MPRRKHWRKMTFSGISLPSRLFIASIFSIKRQSEQILLGKIKHVQTLFFTKCKTRRDGAVINLVKRGRNVACSDGTHRAVVLLLQQGGDVSSDGHLLGQILVLHTDPPPQLLQETQQTRPALGTRLQMGSANAHIFVGPTAWSDVGIFNGKRSACSSARISPFLSICECAVKIQNRPGKVSLPFSSRWQGNKCDSLLQLNVHKVLISTFVFLRCSRHNVSEHRAQRPPVAARQVGPNYTCTAIKA